MSSGSRGKNPTISVAGWIYAAIGLPVSRQGTVRKRTVQIPFLAIQTHKKFLFLL
jgi:hypothetical protein